ncbi:unnamed protein product [Heligmosomoides polygyrus]|uniref:LTD domain-containing protein n=1 Tax=Heligmosomoides polygyrus TaxID=6339 RepID=A0A183G5U1_HELPZ|nr:unnamed protein product [Heligmosomoides polygyrus]
MDRKKALKRWRDYFEEISTVEFPHPAIPSTAPTHGPVQKITVKTRRKLKAVKMMTPGKATGPDDMAAELWIPKFWYPAKWLTKFFNQVVERRKKKADDVMLASEDKDELEGEVQAWCDRLVRFGLRLNVNKTQYLTTDVTESSSIKVKYLGSAVAFDGKLMVEVNSRSIGEWKLKRRIDGKHEIVYTLPKDFVLRAGKRVKIFARNQGVASPPDQLAYDGEESFGFGNSVQTILFNKEGEVSKSVFLWSSSDAIIACTSGTGHAHSTSKQRLTFMPDHSS